VIGAFLLGAFAIGFLWLLVALSRMNHDNVHSLWSDGVTYSTKRANRIFGYNGERITNNGQWIQWVRSLWRTHYDNFYKKHYFFILSIDELDPVKITPVTKEKAEEWLMRNVDNNYARLLIRDWFKAD
jgi:hypothetical protein